jgi:UDP-glucuronate 4-epimerase
VKKRWILIGAGVAVLFLVAAAGAFYLYKQHQSRDIRGSSTVEFVPTEPPPTMPAPPKPRPTPGPRTPVALTRVDWPTFGLDPRRLRYLPSTLHPPFRVEWTFRARYLLEFPPAVAYGRAYIANNPGTLFAISAKTGRLGWHFSSGRCTAASPAVADGLVYETFLNKEPCNQKAGTPGLDGEVVALEARKGHVRWRHRIGPSETSPLVANGLVYVGDWNGYVYALNAKTGREVWRYQTGGEVKGALTLSGNRLYVGSYDHHVYAFAARTGRLIWRASAQERFGSRGTFYSTPTAAYSRIYIGSTDGKVYSFGAQTGELRLARDLGPADPDRLVQRQLLLARRGHRRRPVALSGERSDLRLGDRARHDRLLLDPEGPHLRSRCEDGQAGLELPRRPVLAPRRGARAGLPRRPHEALWDGSAVRHVVTGAAGFIGSHLTEALLAAGHEVRAIDAFTDYYDSAVKEQNAAAFPVERLDLAADPLDFSDADGVFHLAGQPGVRSFGVRFPLYVRHNVLASQRVFEAAARDGVRVVFASSSSVYGEAERFPTPEETPPAPLSPYGITKLTCEHLARASARSLGLDAVVLRYFNAFGPRQRPDMAFTRIATALAEGRPFELYGDGMQSRGFTYVADVVSATVAAMERGRSGTYNVGGGTEASLLETIALFERLAGRPLEVAVGPPVPGDQRRTSADTTRIRSDLGWQPQVSLEEGLQAQWEWVSGRVAAR